MNNRKNWFASAMISISLAACGGGGGGSESGGRRETANRLQLNDANAFQVAVVTFADSEFINLTTELMVSATALAQINDLGEIEFSCETADGRIVITYSDRDGDMQASAGDEVRVDYEDCDGIDGTTTLSIMSIVQTGITFDRLEGTTTTDLRLAANEPLTFTGNHRLSFSIDAASIDWESSAGVLDVTVENETTRSRGARIIKTINAADSVYAIRLSATVETPDGEFDYLTNVSFSAVSGSYPNEGRLTATGLDSGIEFTADDDPFFVRYRVDDNGDGQFGGDTLIAWSSLISGSFFDIADEDPADPPPDPQPPPPNPAPPPVSDLTGRRVDLGATAEEGVVDMARGRLYFSLTSLNEIAIVDLDTLQIVDRVFAGPGPMGLDPSADGASLYVALGQAGAIGVLDLDTLLAEEIVVAEQLGSSLAFDVAETSPGIVFVTANPGSSGFAHVARVDLGAGSTATRVAGERIIGAQPELLANAEGTRLYIGEGFSPNSLYKLDASDSAAPIILEDQHGSIGGTDRMSLSPDDSLIYLRSGQVLRTGSFIENGRIGTGVPAALSNGTEVIVATDDATLEVYDVASLQLLDRFTTDCILADGFVDRLLPLTRPGQWLLLADREFCAVDINNPDQPPGQDGAGPPPDIIETYTVVAEQVFLNEIGFDLEPDPLRGQLYVSLPASGEVVAFSTSPLAEVVRFAVGAGPHGLALGPSGDALAVAFNANGSIGFLDPDTGVLETADLTSMLGDPRGFDIAYVDDSNVFMTANPSSNGFAYVVRTSRLDPAQAVRVASESIIRAGPELRASADGASLFVGEGFSPNSLYRLDLTLPDAPIVAEDEHGTVSGTNRLSLDSDASRIALTSGQVLRTTDFRQAGGIGAGIPQFTADDQLIVAVSADGILHAYDAGTYQERYVIESDCSVVDPDRLLELPALERWALLGNDVLCLIPAVPPTQATSQAKPILKPQGRYRCDDDCLVRRYVAPLLSDPERRRRSWPALGN